MATQIPAELAPQPSETSYIYDTPMPKSEPETSEEPKRQIQWNTVVPLATTGVALTGAGAGLAVSLARIRNGDTYAEASPRDKVSRQFTSVTMATFGAGLATGAIHCVNNNTVLPSAQPDYVEKTLTVVEMTSFLVGSASLATSAFAAEKSTTADKAFLNGIGTLGALAFATGAVASGMELADTIRYNKARNESRVSFTPTSNGIALQGTF